ncbi:MAG: DUF333 domain-containing protein [Chloroflexus sp.]
MHTTLFTSQRRLGLVIALVFGAILAGCSIIPPATPTPAPFPTPSPITLPKGTAPIGLANPAATYCIEQGGRFEIQSPIEGGQVGVCLFADGSLCEEWAFFRGECQPGQQYRYDQQPTGAPTATTITPLAEAFAAVRSSLPPDAFPALAAQLLSTDDSRQLWLIYSVEMRNYDLDPLPSHLLAVYAYADGGWQELDRTDLRGLSGEVEIEPDFVGDVRQVQITPEHIWIQVDGGMGAHSGSYHLFSFDGHKLQLEVVSFSSYSWAGWVEDLNGDGLNEVVLNRSEPYIFCYACGVYYPAYQVYTWRNGELIRLEMSDLTDQTAPFAALNHQALDFAHANLWPEALAAINAAVAQAGMLDPPTTAGSLRWNQRLIQYMHEAHLTAINNSSYPLINEVFYGAYEQVVDRMRNYDPAEIFNSASPLIIGTVAEDWLMELSNYVTKSADQAATVMPDRAAIYVVRAWGRFLADPSDPAIGADLNRAAQLQPADAFFTALAAWWQRR